MLTTTRRSALRAHRYAATRVVTALVTRRGGVGTARLRTGWPAATAGVVAAGLLLAGAAAYGALGPGGADWRTPGAILVERETGTRYVVAGGRLHPVLNYSSALLVVGTGRPRILVLPRRALDGAPRGATLGIPGAPDSLPPPERLLHGSWWVCSEPAGGAARATLRLSTPDDGRPLRDAGLLVRAAGGPVQLLWKGHRFTIRRDRYVLPALGWAGARPVPVHPALLNALPSGPDLDLPAVEGRGRPGAAPGTRIGEVSVLTTAAGARQFLVALADGYALVSPVQADLLLGDPRTVRVLGQRTARRLSAAEYAVAPRSPTGLPWGGRPGPAGPPQRVPALADPGDAACVSASGVQTPVVVAGASAGAGLPVPVSGGTDVPPGPSGGRAPRVDRVAVPGGGAALVGAVTAPGSPVAGLSVVTSEGLRYPVADRAALAALGYADVRPVPVPAAVLALLPVGRTLDRAAAVQPAPLTR